MIMKKTVQLRSRQAYMGTMKLIHFQGFATQHSVPFLFLLLTEEGYDNKIYEAVNEKYIKILKILDAKNWGSDQN